MKKILSKSLTFGALFWSALFFLGAECLAAAEAPASPANTVVTVATVNIYEARILAQEKNNLRVGFDLNNRIGVQSGVKYGIELRSKEAGSVSVEAGVTTYAKNDLADQKIYPETLTLGADETIRREIAYVAPEYLQGKFEVFVIGKNEGGLLLGYVLAGEVELGGSGKYLKLDSSECSLRVSGREGLSKLTENVTVSPTETLSVRCQVANMGDGDLEAVPGLETRLRSDFGSVVSETKGDSIRLAAGEKKELELTVIQPPNAQVYAVRLTLKDAQGRTVSNPIDFGYSVQGTSATIRNATFNAKGYLKGDRASIFVLWMSQGAVLNQETGEKAKITLRTSIVDADGSQCAESFEMKSDDPRYDRMETIPMTIAKDCFKPQVTVSFLDEKGAVLDEKVLGFQAEAAPEGTVPQNQNETPAGKTLRFWLYLLSGGILLVGIVMVFFFRRKPSGMIGLAALVFLSGMFLADGAKADTAMLSVGAGGDGLIFLPGAGIPTPAEAKIGTGAEVTYNHNQCKPNFGATINVDHWDGSGSNLDWESGYGRIETVGSVTYVADGFYNSNTLPKGKGTFNLRVGMDWRWRYGTGAQWHDEYTVNSADFGYESVCPPPNPAPLGDHQWTNDAECTVGGWSVDQSDLNQHVTVHAYMDGPAGTGTFVKAFTADQNYPSLAASLLQIYGIALPNDSYGFVASLAGTPAATGSHFIYLYALDIPGGANPVLLNGTGQLIRCGASSPNITLNAPASVPSGSQATVTWSNSGGVPTSCTASCKDPSGVIKTCAGFTGTVGASGSYNYTITEETTFKVSCTNGGGTSAPEKTVAVTCAPAPTPITTSCVNPEPSCSAGERCIEKTGTVACLADYGCGWQSAPDVSLCDQAGVPCQSKTKACPCEGWIEVAP